MIVAAFGQLWPDTLHTYRFRSSVRTAVHLPPQLSDSSRQAQSECVCNAGFTEVGSTCLRRLPGKFKEMTGNFFCKSIMVAVCFFVLSKAKSSQLSISVRRVPARVECLFQRHWGPKHSLVGHRDALSSWPTYDSRPRCVCAYACPFIIDFYKSTHEDEKSCTELSEINSGYDAAVTRPRRVKHARDDHAGRAAVRGRHSQAPSPRLNLRSRYAPSSTGRNNTATHFAFAARHSTMA